MQVERPSRHAPSPLFRQIAWQLVKLIHCGDLAPGAKLPDEHELARKFDVSRVTIRSALDLVEQEALIIRKRGMGTFVAGPENWGATTAVPSKAAVIGLVFRTVEELAPDLLPSLTKEVAMRGYTLALGYNATSQQEEATVNNLLQLGVEGLVVFPSPSTFERTYDRVIRSGLPIAAIMTQGPFHGVDCVAYDEEAIAALAVGHLAALGHRRIGYVQPKPRPDSTSGIKERLDHFRAHCDKLGIRDYDDWTITVSGCVVTDEDRTLLCERLANRNCPTAFICWNDTLAVPFTEAAHAVGRRVGEDLAVVSVDNTMEARENAVPLTSIDPRRADMVQRAARALFQRIGGKGPSEPRQLVAGPPKLVKRQSTCPVTVSSAVGSRD